MELLTRRQQDVLNYIATVQAGKRRSPTFGEIATAFSVCVGSVQNHVRALRKKGYITGAPRARRGMRLTADRKEWKVQQAWRGEFENRIGSKLRGESDLPRIFELVRGDVRAWLDVERADLLVYDPQRREFRGGGFFGAAEDRTAGERTAHATDALALDSARRRKPSVAKGRAAIPILGGNQVLGVLRLDDRRAAFDETRLSRASLAAAALAPALERGALDVSLRRGIRLQSSLIALCRTMSSSRDLLSVLREVHRLVKELTDAPVFFVAVKDEQDEWWLLYETDIVDGKPWERPDQLHMKLSWNDALRAIQTEPFYIKHRTPEEIRVLEGKGPHVSKEGWIPMGDHARRSRSILYVPLRSGGELIGYLSAHCYRFNAYSVRDAEDLILVGEYVGLLLQLAWRMERDRRAMKELKKRTGAYGRIGEELKRLLHEPEGAERTGKIGDLAREMEQLKG